MLLCGRILIAWIFIRSGYGKLFVQGIDAYSNTFPGRGLPPMLAYIAVPAEFFGGVLLLIGLATRYAIVVMLIFMVVATFSSHAYWTMTDANAIRINDSAFWKNLAMIVGLLFLFVTGPGRFSVDAMLAKK